MVPTPHAPHATSPWTPHWTLQCAIPPHSLHAVDLCGCVDNAPVSSPCPAGSKQATKQNDVMRQVAVGGFLAAEYINNFLMLPVYSVSRLGSRTPALVWTPAPAQVIRLAQLALLADALAPAAVQEAHPNPAARQHVLPKWQKRCELVAHLSMSYQSMYRERERERDPKFITTRRRSHVGMSRCE